MDTIYLIGFMGVGKTTLGKKIASEMALSFLDLDDWFEACHHQSITDWVQDHDMTAFRHEETMLLKDTAHMEVDLIATGGGVVERAENRHFLATKKVVYLEYEFDTIYERLIQESASRPLVQQLTKEALRQRFEQRRPFYEKVANETVHLTDHIDDNMTALMQVILTMRNEAKV